MLKILKKSITNGILTVAYPTKPHRPSAEFRGRPVVDFSKGNLREYETAAQVCPTQAIKCEGRQWSLDYGLCIFCGRCQEVCSGIHLSEAFELAARQRSDLILEAHFRERC